MCLCAFAYTCACVYLYICECVVVYVGYVCMCVWMGVSEFPSGAIAVNENERE